MSELSVKERPRLSVRPEIAVDPRMLARLVSVRRDRRRRHWRVVTVAATVMTLLVGGWIVARSPLLAVRNVEVVGATHTARSAVLAAADLERRTPMLDVDSAAIDRRVEALAWVAGASLRRRWPATVTIAITERVPRAQVKGPDGQAAIVDGQGRVLATGAAAAHYLAGQSPALPWLLGVPAAAVPGTTLGGAAVVAALALLQALGARPVAGNEVVASVAVATDGTLSVTVVPGSAGPGGPEQGPIVVVFGSTDQLKAKVIAMDTVLGEVSPGAAAIIDVRVVDNPVLTYG